MGNRVPFEMHKLSIRHTIDALFLIPNYRLATALSQLVFTHCQLIHPYLYPSHLRYMDRGSLLQTRENMGCFQNVTLFPIQCPQLICEGSNVLCIEIVNELGQGSRTEQKSHAYIPEWRLIWWRQNVDRSFLHMVLIHFHTKLFSGTRGTICFMENVHLQINAKCHLSSHSTSMSLCACACVCVRARQESNNPHWLQPLTWAHMYASRHGFFNPALCPMSQLPYISPVFPTLNYLLNKAKQLRKKWDCPTP